MGWIFGFACLSPAPFSTSAASEAGSKLFWPTDAGTCVTSTFCEFRPGHFHSGLDISTWGKTGYKCFAVGDGEIVRAKVSCGGYGRAVYLRLDDGRYAVYAHLSRFVGALADTVWAIQNRAVDAYFDRDFPAGTFPVKRGDLIGFTGQSGVGVPHLHVEIRDRHERPQDPLGAGLVVEDGAAPEVVRLALTPLELGSSVDGRSDTVILDVHPIEGSVRGRIPRRIPVEGKVGVSVEVFDTADGCRYRLAPRRLELREGEELLYSVEYERFAFSQSSRIDQQIDPRFSYSRVGRFHHVWRRPGNDLPFSRETAGKNGVLEALPGGEDGEIGEQSVRELTLVATDAAGNSGRVDFELSFAAPPALTVLSANLTRTQAATQSFEAELEEVWADTLDVYGAVRSGGRPLEEVTLAFSFDDGRTWHDAPAVVPNEDRTFAARFPALGRVPGEGRGLLLRGQPRDVLGGVGLARTVAVEGSPPPEWVPPPLELVTLGPWVEVRIPEDFGWSALEGGFDGDSPVLVHPWGRGVRIGCRAAEPGLGLRERSGQGPQWKGFDPWGRPVPIAFELPVRIPAGVEDAGIVQGKLGFSSYRFFATSFRESTAVQVREEPAPTPEKELRPLGPLHFLDSGHVPVSANYEVTLWPEETVEFDEARVAIFVQDSKGFRYVGGEFDRASGGWSASSRTPLGLGLFEDAEAPEIGEARLEEERGRIRLTFLAEDEGAGIECRDVEVLFDGAPVLHEFDEETGEGWAYPPIASGPEAEGAFELRATDRCGNSTRRQVTVRLP